MLESIRVYITENCNANCSNCFNRNTRGKSYMQIEKFERLCKYFKDNGVPKIKVMGGEPTMHPDFGEMMIIAQKYFEKVSVFTNGLSENLKNSIRESLTAFVLILNFQKK